MLEVTKWVLEDAWDKTAAINRISSFEGTRGGDSTGALGVMVCPPAAPGRNLGFEVAKKGDLWAPN